jgi:hypothetical protein
MAVVSAFIADHCAESPYQLTDALGAYNQEKKQTITSWPIVRHENAHFAVTYLIVSG